MQHSIDTGDARPIRQRPRRMPYARQAAANQLLREMEDAGIIEPSESPWVSPVVMVPKKDGSWRLCVDYKGQVSLDFLEATSALIVHICAVSEPAVTGSEKTWPP